MGSEAPIGRVTLGTKLAYGIGALSDAIKTFSFSLFVLFFYTTVMGLPGTLVGLAMAVGLAWDSSVDPFIGHLSDRASLRLGRRHGFMLAGALCAGVSFAAVFSPPSGLSTSALFAWLMVSSLCLRSSNSLFMVPYFALGAELTDDYQERTSISGIRTGTVLAGTLMVAAAAFLVFFRIDTPAIDPKFGPGAYASMGLWFGCAITVVGLVATLGTLRAPVVRQAAGPDAASAGLWRGIRSALREPSFRLLWLSSSLLSTGTVINASLGMHYLTYYARIQAGQALTLVFLSFYVGALCGVVLWVRATRAIEKHHVYAWTTVATAVVLCGGYWLVGDGRLFGTGHVWVLVAGNALAGFFLSASSVVGPSMMADITAADELKIGRRRDGVFFGIYSFGQQMSAGLAVLVGGSLIDHFAGLVAGQSLQSDQTAARLAIVSHLVPAVLLVSAAVVIIRYRLTRERVEQTQQQLAATALRSGATALSGDSAFDAGLVSSLAQPARRSSF